MSRQEMEEQIAERLGCPISYRECSACQRRVEEIITIVEAYKAPPVRPEKRLAYVHRRFPADTDG